MPNEQWFGRDKSSRRPIEIAVIAIILIGFVILHAFGESLMQHPSTDAVGVVINRAVD